MNYVGPQDVSPLQWAAQRGKDEAVDYLIQKGAKLDFVSKESNKNKNDCIQISIRIKCIGL